MFTPTITTETVVHAWTDDGVAIPGANTNPDTFTIGSDGVADASVIRWGGTIDGAPYTSNARRIVYAAPIISGVPTISGTTQEGQTLTATAASVTGSGLTRTWQWERSGTPIGGATSSTYLLVSADIGNTITVVQTETNSGGEDSAESTATATITEADLVAPTTSAFTLGTQGADGNIALTITDLSENATVGFVFTTTDQSAASASAIRTAAEGGTALTDQAGISATQALTVGGGPYNINLPVLADAAYYWQAALWDAAGNVTKYTGGTVQIDTTGPTLSGVSTTAGDTTADLDWSTDTGEGTAYFVLTTSATVPSVAQIIAGQDHTGASATSSGSAAVSLSGAQTAFNVTSLTNGTTYHFHLVHLDAHANPSAVSTASVTPAAAAAFLPSDIASLQGWYDASETATITLSGSDAIAFAARAGSLAALDEKAGSGQFWPISGTRTVNSLNTLDCQGDGTATIYSIGDTGASIGYTSGSGKTIVAVFHSDAAVSSRHVFGVIGSGGAGTRFVINAGTGFQAGNGAGALALSTGLNMVAGWISGTGTQDASATLNGQLTPTTQSVTMNGIATQLWVGSYATTNTTGFDGAFCEGLIFDAALSDADRQKVEGYLAHKWGLVASLPVGHPYKSAAP